MKDLTTRLLACALLLFLTFAVPQSTFAQSTCDTDAECAKAEMVGQDVQNALKFANGTGLSGLTMKKAVLTLESTGTVTTGFNISFLIFTIKHQSKKGETVSQAITWGALPKAAGGGNAVANLQNVLAGAIANAAAVASKVTQLPLSEATITIDFAVDKDTNGGLSYKIAGVNLGGNGEFDKASKNTLAVTFSK